MRESEWDDDERAKMLALAEYEADICPSCGFHKSICRTNPHVATDIDYCALGADFARNDRILQAEDDKVVKALGEKPPPAARRPDDGRRISRRLMSPDEISASSEPSPSGR